MGCLSYFFFFKQKTAYEMRISDWSSDVCSSDLLACEPAALARIVRRERLAAGDDPAQSRWHLQSGPFGESDLTSLPERDCSLLVQDVDKWDADVAPLLEAFAFLPRWRIDDIMISFAEPVGPVGLGRASCRERLCTYV